MNSLSHPSVRFFLGLVIALAFLAQSVVPSGYMPQFGTGKFFEITICHGAEQTKIMVDDHMQPVKHSDSKQSDDSKPCVFASVSIKHLALQTYFYQQIVQLTYEQYAPRDTGYYQHIALTKSYLAQAPPATHPII